MTRAAMWAALIVCIATESAADAIAAARLYAVDDHLAETANAGSR